jgi:glycosyltransferase involved in cell wall biosynthesis
MIKRIARRMAGILLRTIFPKFRRKSTPKENLSPKPSINLVTTWNTHCGIATYSAFLADELKKTADLRIVKITSDHVFSPYFFMLGLKAGRSNDLVHVELEFSTFGDLKILHKRLSSFTALLFYLGLATGNRPVITTFHEVKPKVRLGGAAGRVYGKLLNQLVCSVSDLALVHNSESKRLLQKNCKIKEERVVVVPHGSFENPVFLDKEECKRNLNLSGKNVITIPGFVAKHKGHDLALSILPSLPRDVHLLVAGGPRVREDEAYLEELKAEAQKLGVVDRVTFLGYVEDLSVALNATDVALLPYKTITDSGILRLLIAHQVPTVASDLPAFREVYDNYGCIELFKTDDQNDLLEKVKALLSNEQKRLGLRENCLKMWQQTRWSKIAQKHMELYMGLLLGHPDSLYGDKLQKERIAWLKENLSGTALEVGCAGGYVTNYVNANSGLDINKARLRFAKTKYPDKEFVCASATLMPFKERAFETILIPEILEHVPYEIACEIVAESKRVGSKVLITVPNAGKPNYDKTLVKNPEHMWYPTEALVLKMAGNCQIAYSGGADFIFSICN